MSRSSIYLAPLRHGPLSVEALRLRERSHAIGIVGAFVLLTTLMALLLTKLAGILSLGLGAIVVVPALLVWLWKAPERGVYVLLFAAVVQETENPGTSYADDIGQYVPFFQDIATWTHIKGISVSMAELFMLLVLLIWLLKGIAERTLRFDRGSMMWPTGLYLLMVLIGEAHGLASGGDFRVSLWEIRSQVYMVVAYVLASNLIKTRRHVNVLLWLLLIGSGLKGIQGTWRYLITLHGHLQGIEALFPHEQSYFYNAFLTLTAILFLFGGTQRMKRVALIFLPFVMVGSLANQRRAAVLALAVSMLGLLVMTLAVHPQRRRLVISIFVALAVVLPPYYAIYANKSGLIAEPAHAIASAFTPDQRDANSNLYRINEDKDIMATMKTSPIIGYGYGKPMQTPYPLADISGIYIWWNIMPHDSILWVWMRLGTIGFILLWLMIGMALIQAAHLAQRFKDPQLKGLALLIILLIVQEIIFGYLDLQWTCYRNLIMIGVLFALIAKLASFERDEKSTITRFSGLLRLTTLYTGTIRHGRHSLAVRDGRLRTR